MVDFVATVGPPGSGPGGAEPDYTSHAAAEAGEQRDLVSGGDTFALQCYKGYTDGQTDWGGWVTSVANPITIMAYPGDEHNGVEGGGGGVKGTSSVSFCRVRNLGSGGCIKFQDVEYVATADGFNVFDNSGTSSGTTVELTRVLVTQDFNTSSTRKIVDFDTSDITSFKMESCYIRSTGIPLDARQSGVEVNNTTIVAVQPSARAFNNGNTPAVNNTTTLGGGYLSPSVNGEYNATDTGTAPGNNPINNLSTVDGVDFVSPSTNDYNITSGGALAGAGSSPPLVSLDIANNPANNPSDVGCYFIAGAGPVAPVLTTPTPNPNPVTEPDAGTFTSTNTGGAADSLQWEVSSDSTDGVDGTWGDVTGGSGATTFVYTTAATSVAADDGDYYRLRASWSGGADVYSIGARLDVSSGLISLSNDPIEQAQTLNTPQVTQSSNVIADGITQSQLLNSPLATQSSVVSVNSLSQNQVIGQVALTTASVLSIDEISQLQALGQVSISQSGSLIVDGIEQQQALNTVGLTQAHVIGLNQLSQDQHINQVSLIVAGVLALQAIEQGQSLSEVEATQVHPEFIINALEQGQRLDDVGLSQSTQLLVDALAQSQDMPAVAVTTANVLRLLGIEQEQVLSQIQLDQSYVLSLDEINQEQVLDTIRLGGLVIGYLEGELTIITALEGDLTIN